MSKDEKSAAELLREVAAANPEAHNAALARGYGVGPAPLHISDEAVKKAAAVLYGRNPSGIHLDFARLALESVYDDIAVQVLTELADEVHKESQTYGSSMAKLLQDRAVWLRMRVARIRR